MDLIIVILVFILFIVFLLWFFSRSFKLKDILGFDFSVNYIEIYLYWTFSCSLGFRIKI